MLVLEESTSKLFAEILIFIVYAKPPSHMPGYKPYSPQNFSSQTKTGAQLDYHLVGGGNPLFEKKIQLRKDPIEKRSDWESLQLRRDLIEMGCHLSFSMLKSSNSQTRKWLLFREYDSPCDGGGLARQGK